jgi:hypothetical protein
LLYPSQGPFAIDRHPDDLVKRHLTAACADCRLEAGAGSSASLVISDHQCRRCCEWSSLGKPAARPPCGRLPSGRAGTSVVLHPWRRPCGSSGRLRQREHGPGCPKSQRPLSRFGLNLRLLRWHDQR